MSLTSFVRPAWVAVGPGVVMRRRYHRGMAWTEGAKTIDFLLGRSRLERISAEGLGGATAALMQRATKRLETAKAALVAEDFDGAFTNAYDVYRMSGETLLLLQGFEPPLATDRT